MPELRCAISALVLAGTLGAQGAPVLVKDINTGSQSSSPNWFEELGCGTYFSAFRASDGHELWVTDGTSGGTRRVKDIDPGTPSGNPSHLCRLGDRIFFSARTGSSGIELWVTNGTAAGTVLFKDINPNGDSSPRHLTRIGDRIYFAATDGSAAGYELWATDGTVAGTVLVKNINLNGRQGSSPRGFAAIGHCGTFVFTANAGPFGSDPELYVSDGTTAGTQLLLSYPGAASLNPHGLTSVAGGRVVFSGAKTSGGHALWVTDGTTANTRILRDVFVRHAGVPWFAGSDHQFAVFFGGDSALWRTDGTAAGTRLMPGTTRMSPAYPTIVGNRLVLFAGQTAATGQELYVHDGVTVRLAGDIRPGRMSSGPRGTTSHVSDDYGRPFVFADSCGRVFFSAENGVIGRELYMFDAGAWSRHAGRPCKLNGQPLTLHADAPTVPGTWNHAGANAPVGWTAFLIISGRGTLGTGCDIHLDLATTIVLSTSTVTIPKWTHALNIPNDPALLGADVVTQAGYAKGTALAVSNAVHSITGR